MIGFLQFSMKGVEDRMNFGGFCVHCKCAVCEKVAKCEIYYPSTEDYCMYDCQGSEISIASCHDFRLNSLKQYPKNETMFHDMKQNLSIQVKTTNRYVHLLLKLRRHRA